jgi:outer membrane protein assembly factor BamD (BamD/ComL family)
MAMGNANFTRGRYEDAAQHYDTLRKEYPNSEFQVPAHLLGLQAKLRTYQGGLYDGAPLEEADQIARQALTQFGRELGPEKDRLLDATKEISEKKAERDWAMGQFYERKGCYGAARYYYIDLIKNYPLTRHAEIARKRLAEIRDRPDVPPNRFKWLTNLFPSDE